MEKPKLAPGLEGKVEKVVPQEWTIAAYDPRLPAVLSTPAMIGMMEVAAARAVQPALEAGSMSVGTRIEVDHLKAVLAGTKVTATARLVEIGEKFLTFEVEARSEADVIGRGRVFRAIVDYLRFQEKAREATDAHG